MKVFGMYITAVLASHHKTKNTEVTWKPESAVLQLNSASTNPQFCWLYNPSFCLLIVCAFLG